MGTITKISRSLRQLGYRKKTRTHMLKIIVNYFACNIPYGQAYKQLTKFHYSRQFGQLIISLSDEDIDYILRPCRKYLKFKGNYTIFRTSKVSYNDRMLLDTLDISTKNIHCYKIPSFSEVYENIQGTLTNKSFSYLNTLKSDYCLELSDIRAEFSIRLVEAYRKYIFCYNPNTFNSNVLYSCIHKAINARGLDLAKEFKADKRKINSSKFTTRFKPSNSADTNYNGIENYNIDVYGRASSNPEDIVILKHDFADNFLGATI